MSISISYSPVNRKYLYGATSSTVDALTEFFGNPPWKLGINDIDTLTAMSAACSGSYNPYRQLRNAILTDCEDYYVHVEY